eukprot:g68371.t1
MGKCVHPVGCACLKGPNVEDLSTCPFCNGKKNHKNIWNTRELSAFQCGECKCYFRGVNPDPMKQRLL